MNCHKCNTPYESTPSFYQMESRNRLFCFEEVPALKCPECEHLFLPGPTVKIILEKIAELSQGSPIPYIKYKWNKKSNIQTPDELADELLKKGGSSDNDDFDDELGLEPQPPTEGSDESRSTSMPEETAAPMAHAGSGSTDTSTTDTSAPRSISTVERVTSQTEKSATSTISSTRTKGVVVRKRARARTGNAA